MSTTPQTSQKRTNSLSWKLAFSQLGQQIWGYCKLNMVLALIFFICLVLWSETQGVDYLNAQVSPFQQVEEQPDLSPIHPITLTKTDHSQGVQLDFIFGQLNAAWKGSFRHLTTAPGVSSSGEGGSFPIYHIYVPAKEGGFWRIGVSWESPSIFLIAGFMLLLIYQFFSIPTSVLRARNKVRAALQPIYELTATAQNISASGADLAMPLSGTIDALKTITGTHFDRRIPISDEREELQGLAQAINDMLDRLDASYQAQLRFVSDASHELRTPISIIQGYARLLARWGKDDPNTLQESVEAIQSEAVGMQTLVEQLLFLARSDNQSIQLHPKPFNLSELLEEVARETEMIAQDHEITSTIPENIFLVADVQLIKQATRILVDNSIKYSPQDGRITIDLIENEKEVRIQIGDNGIGVPPQELDKLFSRFWRADESRARKTGGTGLGLSIAYWIAESHGGYISVVSREEVGSKFAICIPKEPKQVMTLPSPSTFPEAKAPSTKEKEVS